MKDSLGFEVGKCGIAAKSRVILPCLESGHPEYYI